MKTNVYIDGFNLYYRAVRRTNYKWLDLFKVSQALVPSHEVNWIRYFTAQVLPVADDPSLMVRQAAYIRALQTIPTLTVHWGQFKRREKAGPVVSPVSGHPDHARIHVFEEKGTDVNLATYLIMDGYDGDYEQAVVITNDSDLALPISMVKEKLNLPVGVVNPNLNQRANTPVELREAATFQRRLRESTLRDCQFPSILYDTNGTIRKPDEW